MHEFMSRRIVPTTDDINATTRTVDGSTRGRWDGMYGLSFVNREVSTSTSDIEVVLPNGDLYMGTFRENLPHGNGKYLWADGCMYEGEWRAGKASGRGKFSWPSGATYEGQFKDGRMEGKGTFIGADGDTYRGSWVRDRKHGFGEKWYANGDIYTGLWKWNIQDGDGRYVWTNGNEYIGEWKNGVMCGKGVLIWANGKRYDGDWVDGAPKGNGVFTWPDGDDLGARSGNRRSRRSSMSEKNLNLNLPKICTSESDSDSICDVVGNKKEANDKLMLVEKNEEVVQLRKSPGSGEGTEAKKCGQIVSKGHKSYELILNFQLGIRYSTGKHCALTRELKQSDFDPNEKFWTRFPPEGSKSTPPHQSPDFKWKDYCPMVFKNLRELFEIDPAEYMLAICGSDALRELSSPGKSGSLFYLTHDDRFIIKTLKKSEVKVLLRMLPNYYEHISQCKNSLVTKFFGLHCVKPVGGQKIRFTVMENVFYSEYGIHKRFDLKGSSYGRITDKPDVETDETTTFKDLDLDCVFHLRKSWFDELIRLIDRDCQFLEAENIMDYSLLIGVHYCNTSASVDDPSGEKNDQDYQSSPTSDNSPQSQKQYVGLGRNMPGKAIRVSRMESDQITGNKDGNSSSGHNNGETFNVILYLGVIDILQDYDISKKLEHAYKSFQVDPTSISAVDPKLYSKRFRDFIYKIFQEDRRTGEAEETTNENDEKTS